MTLKAPTHHISSQVGDFAKTVLLPGDPLRAKMIGETYLQDSVCINQVRGLYAYTGYFNGQRVSVMGSGMGGSSTANITWTLFNLYDIDTIIRIGTAGAFQPWLNLFDIIIGQGSSHEKSQTEIINAVDSQFHSIDQQYYHVLPLLRRHVR
jgi:purine-nucleoside phosphorylase